MSDRPPIDQDLTPVPYEDGDHCIFYAVQEAILFFNRQPLTLNDRSKLEQNKKRMIQLGEVIVGEEVESLHWLTASLRLISSKLNENGIEISEIVSNRRIINEVKQDHFIKRSSILTKVLGKNEDYELEYPTLIIIWRESGTHVWCPTSDEKFKTNRDKHIGPNDDIVLVANIRLKR